MALAGHMVGSEIRSSRVALWYGVLPADVQRVVAEPPKQSEDVDAQAERLAESAIAAWKGGRSVGAVLEKEIELVRSLGPAARIRLLSMMTNKDHPAAVNVFATIVRERKAATGLASDDAAASEGSGEGSGAASFSPLEALLRQDLAGLERIIAARLVRSTSAKRNVSAITGGIDEFEKSFTRSQGAF